MKPDKCGMTGSPVKNPTAAGNITKQIRFEKNNGYRSFFFPSTYTRWVLKKDHPQTIEDSPVFSFKAEHRH